MRKDIPVLDSYQIRLDTYLIAPFQDGEKIYSYVYDKSGEYIVKRKPLYIVRRSCKLLGYSYKSALQFSKDFFGKDKHKVPILLPHEGIPNILFPLYSPSGTNNIWVGLHGIANVGDHKELLQEITLLDGKEKTLPVSKTSFDSQYLRAIKLFTHASLQIRKFKSTNNEPLNLPDLFDNLD